MQCLTSRAALEDVVGAQPLGSMLKSIDAFDDHCRAILSVARAAVLGTVDPDGGVRSTLLGGDAGFATVAGPAHLSFPLPPEVAAPAGAPASMLLLVPGLGETLRVNGRLRRDGGGGIDAGEIYLHCAKAVIRSRLWKEPAAEAGSGLDVGHPGGAAPDDASERGPLANPEVRDVLARSPFAVISSHDGRGAADTSPKGDPPGFVRVLDDRTLAVPDRPGNFRTDTWHNLVERPDLGLLLLVPGDDRVLEVRGTGRVTTDEAVREPMAVRGRVPKVALVVDVTHAEVVASPVPAAAALWDTHRHVDRSSLPPMAQVFTDHVKLNRSGGAVGDQIRAAITAPALDEALEVDYRDNLY